MASLVNVALGVYLVTVESGWKALVTRIGSVLAIVSPPILCYAFFAEAPKAAPGRLLTALGVFVLLLGVLAQLPNCRTDEAREAQGAST
jgi:hypothetical protein